MRHVQALVGFVVIGLLPAGVAHAQSAPPAGSASKVWAGGHLGLSPLGTLEASALGVTVSNDAATAFEIGGLIEFHAAPILSIGFQPTLLLNVKGTNANQSGSELDLPLRVAVGSEVAPPAATLRLRDPGILDLVPATGLAGQHHASVRLHGGVWRWHRLPSRPQVHGDRRARLPVPLPQYHPAGHRGVVARQLPDVLGWRGRRDRLMNGLG